ncbi:sugar MFS transporter [Alkalihalobacillus sp. TS-13]|uniref:MFS transporter n=1 Tax=Alkalihalobacillus sp. TS-13 TaxID=2842455 RepID=UPI001C885E0B|nr:MFS transporter [Alkalihalobacillus sp. TS-13]
MSKIKSLSALVIMFFTMLLLGGLSSTKGIVLDEVERDIGLDLSQFGLVVFIFQLGFVLASVIIGYFTDKRGVKVMMVIGCIIMGAGLLGTGLAQTIAFFLGFYLIVGFGLGAMTVASNAIVPAVYPEKQGTMFNIAMGIYGFGMFIFPIVLKMMFSNEISWRYFYIGIAILLIALIFYVLSVKLPEGEVDKVNLSAFKEMLGQYHFILVMIFLIFYVSAEVSFLNFFPTYLKDLTLGGASEAAKNSMVATIISVFSLCFTVGRLAGGWLINMLGERMLLLSFSALSLVFVTISKVFVDDWVYLFGIAGLFFSVLFPTATAIGTKLSRTGGSALGLVYVAAGIGGAFAGWIVGVVSEAYGSDAGFNLPIVFLAILLVLSFFIRTPGTTESAEGKRKA